MRIKKLFLLACLFSTVTLGANNNPLPTTSSIPQSSDDGTCNQPAPFNFHIEAIGSTWVRYEWGGNVTFQHRLRTYRASDNALLNTTIVPAGTLMAVINGLAPGTEIYGVINAICSDGSNSPFEAISGRGTTVIVDLLVQELQPPSQSKWDCKFSGTGSCPLYGNPIENSYYKIYKTTNPTNHRVFALRLSGAFHFKTSIHEDNSSNNAPFDFKCNGIDPDPQDSCSGPDVLEVWSNTEGGWSKIGTISAYQGSQTNVFTYAQIISGYTIENIIPDGERGMFSGSSLNTGLAAISPNPFSDELEVFPAQPNAETIHLQLYNLSGQKVLDQKFSGGQDQYSLNTAALSPGFYLLRVEADGEVQTLKVIKSE